MRQFLLACAAASLIASPAHADMLRGRIYQPVSLADTEAKFNGTAPQDVTTTTADGLTLAGYYWPPAEGSDRIVVVFHGASYNQLVSAVRAEGLTADGTGVLVASYRGYGDNPGTPNEAGLYADGEAWLARARALAPGKQVYLLGFSLGGSVALELAARHDVDGVFTLGAFRRLSDQAPRLARGLLRDRYDNEAKLPRIAEPLVMMHGTKDDVVRPVALDALEKAGGNHALAVRLTGGAHYVALGRLAPKMWEWLALARTGKSADAP